MIWSLSMGALWQMSLEIHSLVLILLNILQTWPMTLASSPVMTHFRCVQCFFCALTAFEILKAIYGSKSFYSIDSNGFSVYILKRCACYVIKILSYIFNKCIYDVIFPEALKRAIIIPVVIDLWLQAIDLFHCYRLS